MASRVISMVLSLAATTVLSMFLSKAESARGDDRKAGGGEDTGVG